jgi:hypothetical protein
MGLGQQPQLAALARGLVGADRRDLEVEVEIRQVEVGSERLERPALLVAPQDERARLVLPAQAVLI